MFVLNIETLCTKLSPLFASSRADQKELFALSLLPIWRKSKALEKVNGLMKTVGVCSCEEKTISLVYCSFLFDIFLVKSLLGKPIKKESVVIMPAFGVQLETHYVSGNVIRFFVPIDKILKPVLIECVTPVTCYWTLSLIIRGESEMMLVFKNLRPPVKILVPVWKALCAATGSKEETCAHAV
ncbi:phosphatidylinositol glycan [Vigna unguiculata]|uniref:Phosphatidylinositol glycan n=1 Tax=Vigna unguiculata TaxID=3917 RepID=A0A4D6LQM4_VIGUN|nr:phosphatidylinositol glycan [Vigna unguiculata]